MELFMNGCGYMKAENGKYWITDNEWEVYIGCSRNEFIKELKAMSWVCLTTWDKELRQQYLDLVDYVKGLE